MISVFFANGTPVNPISTPKPQQVLIILAGGTEISFLVNSGALAFKNEGADNIEIIYSVKTEHWLDSFESLYHNDFLKYSLQAA